MDSAPPPTACRGQMVAPMTRHELLFRSLYLALHSEDDAIRKLAQEVMDAGYTDDGPRIARALSAFADGLRRCRSLA